MTHTTKPNDAPDRIWLDQQYGALLRPDTNLPGAIEYLRADSEELVRLWRIAAVDPVEWLKEQGRRRNLESTASIKRANGNITQYADNLSKEASLLFGLANQLDALLSAQPKTGDE